MGNGGDNGNGSAGTFYEGIITAAYPSDAAINAVQANIVAARVQRAESKLCHVSLHLHLTLVTGRHSDIHKYHRCTRDRMSS